METNKVLVIIRTMKMGNTSKSIQCRENTTKNSVSNNNSKSENNITNSNNNHNKGFNNRKN